MECLHYLYRICGQQALILRSLTIRLDYDVTGDPRYRGRFADVWKGQYQGRDVAVKVLKLRSEGDPGEIRKVGCRWSSQLAKSMNNRLPFAEVLQGGCGMERPPS